MEITGDTLPSMIGSVEFFRATFQDYAKNALWPARLSAKLSFPRLVEAHGCWIGDLERVERHKPNLNDGLDHFKQAGHLSFWIRRMSPVIELFDPADDIQDGGAYDIGATAEKFRKLLLPYFNEYLAFDFGFQIVNYYEVRAVREDRAQQRKILPLNYYQTVCHFLKCKNVSPHALHLIYKSLYM